MSMVSSVCVVSAEAEVPEVECVTNKQEDERNTVGETGLDRL
jgi:hypothetical protein